MSNRIGLQLRRIALMALCVLACSAGSCTQHEVHWSYEGHTGPQHWGGLDPCFSLCSDGTSQSPVDIRAVSRGDLAPLVFGYHPTPMNVVNNGHTIQVNYAVGSSAVLGGHEYHLRQFHFHVPSEHEVDGSASAMEAHLVHTDDDGNIAVVGVLFRQSQDNPLIQSVWDHMPTSEGENKNEHVMVDVAELLPSDCGYYHYRGSLTTPPCSENVHWYVLMNPVEASEAQIARFDSMFHGNARPVQPLNDRKIVTGG